METTTLRSWRDLGVVDTIYEEDQEDFSTPSLSSPSLSLPPTPLRCRLESWSLATGCEANVLIHVQDSHFYLHKDPLAAKSRYLKRQLNESPEITLSPPLNITVETFTLVADFCYGNQLVITPFNVAALRVAAELLEMTETNGADDDDNLRQKTEAYFFRAVALSLEYALIVFRSCLPLLPESETTAGLASRCIEALSLFDDGDGVVSCFDDVKTVRVEDFQIVAESMHCRLTESHDLLYRIVDHYLKEHDGKITEEQKTRICNSIDCTILSPHLLMHAVQNPIMPLRFVVQAMFIEQLNTRRSIISAADNRRRIRTHNHHPKPKPTPTTTATLGAILERDAAIRHAAQLKASMDATCSRLQSLEKELDVMKNKLIQSHNKIESESGRSVSSRFSSENKIERGQNGSVSSGSFRGFMRRSERVVGGPSTEGSREISTPRVDKKFGLKLISRLKSAFGGSKKNSHGVTRDGEEFGDGDVVVIKKDQPFHHHRSHSLDN